MTFGYDRTHQITSADRSTDDEAYAYDATGNRTTANGATYVTDPNNCLADDGTFTYTYDDEGNRLTRVRKSGAAADDKTVEYTWDYRNRLEKVTFKRNDGTVTKTVDLRYDFLNRLTQKVVDPDGALGSASLQTDDYLWNGDELVGISGYNSLVFASGPALDMVLFESATTLHALLGDHQNTVRDVISTSGALANHLVYSAYGELKSQTGGGAYSPFHRFTGKPFHVAVGLQYNVNRWYDPFTGRWISEDPIGFASGDANLNRFVGNSPVNGTDPFGLAAPKLGPISGWLHRTAQDNKDNPFIAIPAGMFTGIAAIGDTIPFAVIQSMSDAYDQAEQFERTTTSAAQKEISKAGRGIIVYGGPRAALPASPVRRPPLLPPVTITKTGKVVPIAPKPRINKLKPDADAVGPHTTFMRDPQIGQITKYQTWYPQTNPRNPNPWQSGIRFDLQGKPHFNKDTGQYVPTPHVHDPSAPGGVRPARPDEIPTWR